MNKIIIFGGTTEGRQLAMDLARESIYCVYSVATEYGKMMVEDSPFIDVRIGRMDAMEMASLFAVVEPAAIVDATHPYASIVKVEIANALRDFSDVPFFRLLRPDENINYDKCHFFDSVVECARALSNTTGNIFLTTGSKELKTFCSMPELKERIIARVIPNDESLKICYDNGLTPGQIIAMQGPFTMEMNYAFLKNSKAKYIVMKESGSAGGEIERINAAKAAGAECFIIKRPKEDNEGLSYAAVKAEILKLCGKELNEELDNIVYDIPDAKVYVTLAGFGMGYGSMTLEVREAINSADVIFGAARMLVGVERECTKYPYYKAEEIIPALEKFKISTNKSMVNVVILFSGDTGFYSGATKLYQELKIQGEYTVKMLPGISSISAIAARLNETWQDAKIISTHGIDDDKWIPEFVALVMANNKVIAITAGAKDLRIMGELLTELEESGRGNYTVAAAFNLYGEEKIRFLNAKQCCNVNDEGLCTVLIKNRVIIKKRLVPGLYDEAFIREKIPMSKEEIRALSICKLGITENSIVYDVGSGTGSVAVELGLISPKVLVYAIELKPEACQLIDKNIKKFNLKNVKVVEGVAPDALKGLPVPSHVFIGGSAGRLEDILCQLKSHLMPMTIVINAVTIETIAEVTGLLKKYEIQDSDIIEVAVGKAKKAGEYSVMQGQNPVYIITFKI